MAPSNSVPSWSAYLNDNAKQLILRPSNAWVPAFLLCLALRFPRATRRQAFIIAKSVVEKSPAMEEVKMTLFLLEKAGVLVKGPSFLLREGTPSRLYEPQIGHEPLFDCVLPASVPEPFPSAGYDFVFGHRITEGSS